jgi:predicted MFS family arabinose efflux permease
MFAERPARRQSGAVAATLAADVLRAAIQGYRSAFSGLPRDVWLLALGLLVNRSGSMVLPFIGLYLTHERGLSVPVAGRLLALYGAGSIAGSWLGGWLSDRTSPTRAQQTSLVLSGFAFLAFTRLTGTIAIAVAMLLLSVVAEAYRPAALADLSQRAPAAVRARSFALVRLAANLGVGIAPAVGGFLVLQSYRWLFVADAATCWLAAGVLALTLGSASRAAVQDAATAGPGERSPWSDRPFLGLLLLVVLLASVLFQMLSTLPLFLREARGLREDAIGLLLALNPLLIVLFEMVLVQRAERRQALPLIGAGGLLLCLGFGLLPLGTSVAWIALAIAVWTLGEMLSLPLANALVAARPGSRHRGRYMGLYTSAFSCAFVFAPALGTWVYHHFGHAALWYGVGAMGPLLWFLALALGRGFRDTTARAA